MRELLADETAMPVDGGPWGPHPAPTGKSCCDRVPLITADTLPHFRKAWRQLIEMVQTPPHWQCIGRATSLSEESIFTQPGPLPGGGATREKR